MKKFNENRFGRTIKILAKVVSIIHSSALLDEKVFLAVTALYAHYETIETEVRIKINFVVNVIFDRNKELVNKYSNDTMVGHLVEAYKLASNHE